MNWYYEGKELDRWATEPEVWETESTDEDFGTDLEER
jgi:hypothetical protein